MKKLIFATAALCAAATISAQEVVEAQAEQTTESTAKTFKGGSDRFGAEVGLSLGNGFNLSGGTLNFNYSLSDETTLRLGFGFNVNKEAGTNAEERDFHTTNSALSIKPGIVHSFTGTDRLEPYIGAELLFGMGSKCEFNEVEVEDKVVETETKSRNPFFGANAFTGFNFYVAKDLYIGAEVGLGFTVAPETHVVSKDEEGKVTDSKDNKAHQHETNIGVNFNPAIRVGWKF